MHLRVISVQDIIESEEEEKSQKLSESARSAPDKEMIEEESGTEN